MIQALAGNRGRDALMELPEFSGVKNRKNVNPYFLPLKRTGGTVFYNFILMNGKIGYNDSSSGRYSIVCDGFHADDYL
ncbi:hypothetical protein CEXT_103541 [Caerostris extrusa]|uniref:Uncharacterized protein n=1 Tax=Caerostris extrusa TaxID=172846 RepID=A0AAV4R3B6_CAEEX|nr:hypothetical protein CEXT_103541 [Caerostris extrusa]